MSSIVNFLRKVYPDFAEARKARRDIRQQYRKNWKALERNDDVSLILETNNNTEYLTRRAEEAAVEADHLIKKYGSQSDLYQYRLTSNEKEVKEKFKKTITKIDRRNWLSYFMEFVFIAFVTLSFAASVLIGVSGVDKIVEWLV